MAPPPGEHDLDPSAVAAGAEPGVEPGVAPGVEPGAAEAYRAVRAHELMLNEASSALERSVVAPLLTLNGGAAVAFLTLLGALGADAPLDVDVALARLAAGTWMLGLVLAAVAASMSSLRQSALNQAHRLMREAVEQVVAPALAAVIAPEPLTPQQRDRARRAARERAARAHGAFRVLWTSSAAVFVAGGALATLAVGPAA